MTAAWRHARRWSGGLVALACGFALTGCGSQSSSHTAELETFLRSDTAVAAVTVAKTGSYFTSYALGQVTLKDGADLDAFAQRVAAKLKQDSSLAGAQVDATLANDGYSIVADDARTSASKNLGAELQQRYQATAVKGFLGDVQVTVPSSDDVPTTYAEIAADSDVEAVAGSNGSVRVGNGTDSLGKRGGQAMDKSFLPAIAAGEQAGVTAYTAYMDRYKGPSFDVKVDTPEHLATIYDAMRGAGYTGSLTAESGVVSINDDNFVGNVPAAGQIAQLAGVSKVALEQIRSNPSPDQMDLREEFNIVADASTPLSTVSKILESDAAQDNAGGFGITFRVTEGTDVAEGSRGAMPYKLTVLQAMKSQQGVVRVSALNNELVVVLDADHPELWEPACATLRAHRWIGQQTIHLITERNGQQVAQARFESTATGVASVVNTGPGSDEQLLNLWNQGALK